MFEEEEEDCNCTGKDILKEQLAQLSYENKRLKEELDLLRRNSFGIEEHLNSLNHDFKKKDSDLKRSEQTVSSLHKTIQEKDNINDALERTLLEVKKENKKLEINLREVKAEKDELIEQNELLVSREKELKEKHNTIEMELSDLLLKFNSLSEKNASYGLLLDDLRLQVQVLEDEKITLQNKIFEDKYGLSSPLAKSSYSPFKIGSPTVQRCLDFSVQKNHSLLDTGFNHLSLKEELLIAKIEEKQLSVQSLEEKLHNSEKTVEKLSRLLQERLREAINVIVLLWNNAGGEFELIFPPLKSYFEKLIGTCRMWSDGQLGEKNPLTEAPDTVRQKEAIISAQPASNRTVESISTATQTDRILLARAFEDFGPFHNVLDYKYNDVDMDLYRSCRKLSVLPEEEDDETFKRIPSLKNTIYSKPLSAKLPETYKTHSADDILNFEKSIVKVPSSEKLISSCTNIILSGPGSALNDNVEQTEFFEGSPKGGRGFPTICDNKLSDNNNFKSEQKSMSNPNQSQLGPLDPLEALRQPHSFDSYLDPQQVHTTPLPRQISDPIQNATFDPPLTRRGSYLKRPRSTCRPLRLPCEENSIKREERVSKVRFDLSNNANSKSVDNTNGSKGPMPASNLKNHGKIERISRFTVERVDEDEFRKSIEESNKMTNRKRPPLIHSVVYKKSVLHDITFYDPESSVSSADVFASKANLAGSPDSPYETATENSPVDSFEMANYEGNYLMADVYSTKRRKQSDSSNYSVDSQDSINGSNIFVKSIRLHTNGEYITMKELDRDSSNSSSHLSVDMDIPYIDAEELPVIKPSPEVMRRHLSEQNDDDLETERSNERGDHLISSPQGNNSVINQSDSSETFVTACSDMTPMSDMPEMCLSPPKSSGLSKSPTVLKNLSNFELYNTVSESITCLNQNKRASIPVRNQTVEEEDESVINGSSRKLDEDRDEEEEESTILKLTSSDGSEMSDTVTYVTVKSDPSNLLLSSDCDSDTYVTIRSDKSALERKFSDLSENSSSPYNTPPDTSSASFCTPPDTYSPILSRLAKRLSGEGGSPKSQTRSSSPYKYIDQTTYSEYHALPSTASPYNSPPCSSPFKRNFPIQNQEPENESVAMYNIDESNFPSEKTEAKERKESVIFDSPKLEFYETNDSIENLEAFLKTEEGLQEFVKTPLLTDRSWKFSTLEDLQEEPAISEGVELKNSDVEEGFFSKGNSGESQSGTDSKFFEKRSKRHPPLSRQNSTEEYNFLEPHDSCLNLSEEISSPSTTPDTSNKTVVFKSKPLTVSNTIDLEDDDFPISDSEIHINFNGSETEIVEILIGEHVPCSERRDIYSCRSEPCIPSISSSELPRLPKQSCSMTEDKSVEPGPSKFEGNALTMPPEIIVSNLSSESNNHSDAPVADFASNVSDRSEINLSDLNSSSMHSDNPCSNSERSDNLPSAESPELQLTDREISLSLSPEVSDNTSNSSAELLAEVLDLEEPETAGAGDTNTKEESEQFYVDIREPITYENSENIKVLDLPDDDEVDESQISKKYPSEGIQQPKHLSPPYSDSQKTNVSIPRMSGRNTEVGEDHKYDKPSEGCISSYSSTENSTEECLTIHGNIQMKSAENNSTPKHTSDELDTMVAVQSELDVEEFQIDNVNEAVSNADAGIVMLIDGKTTLSEEEVEKKFQEISLAFRTDIMMLQQRLIIRKRLKDQAELNLVKEIDLMKTKLNNLRYLCCDSDSLERLSDLRKHLDIVFASANYLSGSSEAYGFVQNEEKMSGAVSIIIKKIDSLERIQEEMSKSPSLEKTDNKRIQLLSILDDDRHEERMVRRRSVAAFALNGSTKRRASIASVPRNSLPSDDSNSSQYSSYSSISSNRNSGTATKKISSSQSNSPKPISPLAVEEKTHARFRKESRIGEDSYGMKFAQDYDSHVSDDNYDLLHVSDEEISNDEGDMKNDMPLSALRMSGSFGNRTRTNSAASETLNIIDSLRKVVKWNVILIRNSRFQCPENIRQYVPFFITWYVVMLVGAIFTTGFLTGFSRCFNFQLLCTYSIISGIVTFWITVISMILKCNPMKFTLVTALLVYLYSLHYTLHEEGIDAVVKRLGVEFEIMYASGAPI